MASSRGQNLHPITFIIPRNVLDYDKREQYIGVPETEAMVHFEEETRDSYNGDDVPMDESDEADLFP